MPDWLKCTRCGQPHHHVRRAILRRLWCAPSPGRMVRDHAVIVDVPIGDALNARCTTRWASPSAGSPRSRSPEASARRRPDQRQDPERPIPRRRSPGADGWVSPLDHIDWASGDMNQRGDRQLPDGIGRGVPVALRTVARPHQQPQFRAASPAALAIVGTLFLIIQAWRS